MRFTGRTCVITGAARGMGRALALRYAAEGASIAILDMNMDGLKATQEKAEALGAKVLPIALNLCNSQEIRDAVEKIEGVFGAIHVLANCAGISNSTVMLELEEEVWDRVMGVNLKAIFLLSQLCARNMIKHGVAHGKIVSISSQASKIGEYGGCVYDASKAAVNMLTQVFGLELAQYGISVTAVCPGFVDTEMIQGWFENSAKIEGITTEAFKSRMMAQVPIGRLAAPDEVAALMAFLSSDEGTYITGESINITGGKTNV